MAVFTSKLLQVDQKQTPVMNGNDVSYMQVDNLYYAEFECDTAADLPDKVKTVDTTAVKGTITLVVGCKAHVIEDDEDYKLMSDGTWKLQRGTDVTALVNAISQVEDDLQDTAADAAYARSAIDYFIRPKLGEIIDTIGIKNMLEFNFLPYTNQNVTYTNNGDGTISLSGTSTGFSYINVATLTLKAGDLLHLSGCPSGGDYTSTYCLYIAKNVSGAATLAHEEGDGVFFTVPENGEYNVRILARNGTATTGLVYKPMLCTYEDWEYTQKFVPYIPTNQDLQDEIVQYSIGNNITTGTNLNDLTTPGTYKCASATIAASLQNCPWTASGFHLEVITSQTYTVQILSPISQAGAGIIYRRGITSSPGSWYKFEGTAV